MILLEKLKILASLQKMPKNVEDLGKLIDAKGFEKLPQSPINRPIWSHWVQVLAQTIWRTAKIKI